MPDQKPGPMTTEIERRVKEATTEIGPYYKAMAFVALLGAIGLSALGIWKGLGPWIIGGLAGIFAFLILALVRPPMFDAAFKTVLDKLPFTKYTKPEGDK